MFEIIVEVVGLAILFGTLGWVVWAVNDFGNPR